MQTSCIILMLRSSRQAFRRGAAKTVQKRFLQSLSLTRMPQAFARKPAFLRVLGVGLQPFSHGLASCLSDVATMMDSSVVRCRRTSVEFMIPGIFQECLLLVGLRVCSLRMCLPPLPALVLAVTVQTAWAGVLCSWTSDDTRFCAAQAANHLR